MQLIDHKSRTITPGTADNLAPFAEGLLVKRSRHYGKVPAGAAGLIRARIRRAAESDSLTASIPDAAAELRFNSPAEAAAWLTSHPLAN